MAKKTNLKLLFIYNHQYPDLWKDGLWAALNILEQQYIVTRINIAEQRIIEDMKNYQDYDFILGWGGFNSPVDNAIQLLRQLGSMKAKYGLCLAGNAFPITTQQYDVIFHETEWVKQWLTRTKQSELPKLVHAFGYNSNIYELKINNSDSLHPDVIDYLTVGSFSAWKRQEKMLQKKGIRMAIGEIQKDNLSESMDIIGPLLIDGVMVSDMIPPEKLVEFYNLAKTVYIPADVFGGGERAVLEARACGTKVEVEDDNPKLQELLTSQIWSHYYYAEQLQKGIKESLENINS